MLSESEEKPPWKIFLAFGSLTIHPQRESDQHLWKIVSREKRGRPFPVLFGSIDKAATQPSQHRRLTPLKSSRKAEIFPLG